MRMSTADPTSCKLPAVDGGLSLEDLALANKTINTVCDCGHYELFGRRLVFQSPYKTHQETDKRQDRSKNYMPGAVALVTYLNVFCGFEREVLLVSYSQRDIVSSKQGLAVKVSLRVASAT